MKKLLFTGLVSVLAVIASFGQSFDWNARGGLNLMNSKSDDKNLAVLYHFGVQAGVRITNFGIYGEALYSLNEDQYGEEPIAYFIPSVLGKGYFLKFVFVEFGGSYLLKIGDSGVDPDVSNPDKTIMPFAGLGAHFSKVEVSLRSVVKQSYGLIEITAAIKF
jgi:hypothetical protein